MRTLLATFGSLAAGSVIAASVMLACASSEEIAQAPVAPASDAQPDAPPSSIADASDAGTPLDANTAPRPPFDAAPPEITCAVTPCMRSIVAGPRDYCATSLDGVVRCWGESSLLGDFVDGGDPNAGATPVPITGFTGVVDVGMSDTNTCIASADGGVSCFGPSSPTPTAVPSVVGAKKLAVGDDRKCAVLSTGALSCWGDNYSTGSGETTTTLPEPVVAAEQKFSSAFALGAGGTLFSWGSEPYSLGRPSALSPDLTPSPVLGLPPAMQIAASDSHICAITKDGRLFCWGRDDAGVLGLGYVRHEFSPVEVLFPGPAWPAQVAAAITHSCARMTDGSLTCWGNLNYSGELGYPSPEGVFIPTKVTSLKKEVVEVAIGKGSTCVLVKDGSVQCWGDNSAGQLGRSTRDEIRHPDPAPVLFQ